MDKNEILEKLFSQDKQLPTLPVIFDKLNQMLANPLTSNKKIADLIMKDPSMVAKVLKLSNSAMYSTRQEITNLTQAITFLGLRVLKDLVLNVSLVRVFTFEKEGDPDFDIATFWEHSLGTAYFTKSVVKKMGLPDNENYYIAGLLHDIGKLVMYQLYPKKFLEIVKLQKEKSMPDLTAEEHVLGVNHSDVGGYLAEKWNFNPEIVSAIRSHHIASELEQLFVAVVQVANMFAKASGLGFSWDSNVFDIVGDSNWQVIAKQAGDVKIEEMVLEIMKEAASVRESVKELLSTT